METNTLTETNAPESLTTNEDEIARAITTASDKESNVKGNRDQLRSSYPKCSWSISCKGCILPGIDPKVVCSIEGCKNVFHPLCQTEWEFFQYHLECPQGDLKDCTYDSGGKKHCIHHHSHHNLAIKKVQPTQQEQTGEKKDTHDVKNAGKNSSTNENAGKNSTTENNLPIHHHPMKMLGKTLLTIRSLMKKVLSRSRLERTKRILMM